MQVRAKKHLGQHFLTDKNIAEKIVQSLTLDEPNIKVLEVGPGMGVLTDFMYNNPKYDLKIIDIDRESIAYLKEKYPLLEQHIIEGDFLKLDLSNIFPDTKQMHILGNFPYNISSQILFAAIDSIEHVYELVGMFQKEVAERVVSKPGSKEYGILSVVMQAFFEVEYLFTVNPGVFNPPPKVKSAVIRAVRRSDDVFDGADPKKFRAIVKMAFNQRRKTLRNALKQYMHPSYSEYKIFDLRAERLSVEDFVYLTKLISQGENTRN